MSEKKKLPDYYVENRSTKEYPTEVGAPKFSPNDISIFKEEKTHNVKKYYTSKLSEIEKEYTKIVNEILTNERLYSAKCTIQPIPGDTYHLYKRENGEEFISIISPKEWNRFEYIGEFKFLSDGRWEKVEY